MLVDVGAHRVGNSVDFCRIAVATGQTLLPLSGSPPLCCVEGLHAVRNWVSCTLQSHGMQIPTLTGTAQGLLAFPSRQVTCVLD